MKTTDTDPVLIDRPMPIETPRLILRPSGPRDAIEINREINLVWSELQKWMSWAHDGEQTMAATEKYLSTAAQRIREGNMPLIGFCKTTGRMVVSTGLLRKDDGFETGYFVTKDFLGRGYATEATNAAIRYGFNVMAAQKIFIEYFEDNHKSRKVIEKLGFTYTGTRPKARTRCSNGELLDVHEYIMTDPSVMPPLDVRWGPP